MKCREQKAVEIIVGRRALRPWAPADGHLYLIPGRARAPKTFFTDQAGPGAKQFSRSGSGQKKNARPGPDTKKFSRAGPGVSIFFFPQVLFFFFFVFLIFNFISPNVCHWDIFFWRGATEFAVTETIIFPFFFVNKQPIFLSQRPYFCRTFFRLRRAD